MNRSDLIHAVAQETDLSKRQATDAVNATLDLIVDALQNRETVTLRDFGSFTAAERPARTGRNPATGAPVDIPAHFTPKFKAARSLKDAVK